MSKIGIVTKFEIVRQLKKPSFWIALLLLPLGIFAVMALSTLNGYNTGESISSGSDLSGKKIGLTNESGFYEELPSALESLAASTDEEKGAESQPTTFALIESKEAGIEKIKSGELNIFYYFPADFSETGLVEIYQQSGEVGLLTNYSTPINALIKNMAIEKLAPEDQLAALDAIQYRAISLDQNGEEDNLLGDAILPIIVLAIFYVLICVFGNRLMTALTEEKENRISEMILTSTSARDLVIGKIISLITLGFIQIAVFIIPAVAAVVLYRDNEIVSNILGMISLNPWLLISNILLLLVSYFFFAGSCTLISSMMPTARDANNYAGVVMMGIVLPLFFMSSFMSNEPSLITYILTYFPLSAPLALMMRNAFGSLSGIELIAGIAELTVCSAAVIALTVKSFQKNAINFSVAKLNFKPKRSWKK